MPCCLSIISIVEPRQIARSMRDRRDDILLLASDCIVGERGCPELLLRESTFFLCTRYGVRSMENTEVDASRSIVCVDMPTLYVRVHLVKIALQGPCRPRFADDAQYRHVMQCA